MVEDNKDLRDKSEDAEREETVSETNSSQNELNRDVPESKPEKDNSSNQINSNTEKAILELDEKLAEMSRPDQGINGKKGELVLDLQEVQNVPMPNRRTNRGSVATPTIDRRGGLHLFDSPINHSMFHFYYNLAMDFLIVCLIGLEVSLVLTVSIVHFSKYASKGRKSIEEGIISLFPILYNFLGVMWFLSQKRERAIIEKIFPKQIFLTDIFQIPVFGPFFTTLSVFVTSFRQNSDHEFYERLEASATKMRQSVTFFSSAPEACVQLSILLLLEDDPIELFLELGTVFVAIFSIAEANVYGMVCNYFKLFNVKKTDDEKEWRMIHAVKFNQKICLFLHAFFSCATNLLSRSFLTTSAIIYFKSMEFSKTFIILILLFANTLIRQGLYYFYRIIKYFYFGRDRKSFVQSSYYKAFNYGWRSTILNFDFQSKSNLKQIWFYIESGFGYIFWLIAITNPTGSLTGTDSESPKYAPSAETFWLITGIFASFNFLSIILLIQTRYFLSLNVLQKFVFSSQNLFTQGKFINNIIESSPITVSTSASSTLTMSSKRRATNISREDSWSSTQENELTSKPPIAKLLKNLNGRLI